MHDQNSLPTSDSAATNIPAPRVGGRGEVALGGRVTISPPANVNLPPEQPFRVLASGIDSLYLAIDIHWKDETFFAYLDELKASAQQQGQEIQGELTAVKDLGKWRFAIQPHGSDGYEWLLIGREFALKIGRWLKPKTRPSVMAEIRSEPLWRIGVGECVAALSVLLRGSGAEALLIKPSRADLCLDLLFPEETWTMGLLPYRVTRAHKSQAYMQNDRLTGFMIGGGKFSARLYDKPFEIEKKSKKTWMYSIWKLPQVPHEFRVIRIEFQIRREGLKEMGIEVFDDLIKHQANLWRYCSDNWLKFMDCPGKHHITQRTVLPWWVMVQEGYSGAQSAAPLIRAEAFRRDRERLFQQAQGLLSSLVALHLEDTGTKEFEPIDFNDLLIASFESSFAGSKKETFEQKVKKKLYKYQRLASKQETTKRMRDEFNHSQGNHQ